MRARAAWPGAWHSVRVRVALAALAVAATRCGGDGAGGSTSGQSSTVVASGSSVAGSSIPECDALVVATSKCERLPAADRHSASEVMQAKGGAALDLSDEMRSDYADACISRLFAIRRMCPDAVGVIPSATPPAANDPFVAYMRRPEKSFNGSIQISKDPARAFTVQLNDAFKEKSVRAGAVTYATQKVSYPAEGEPKVIFSSDITLSWAVATAIDGQEDWVVAQVSPHDAITKEQASNGDFTLRVVSQIGGVQVVVASKAAKNYVLCRAGISATPGVGRHQDTLLSWLESRCKSITWTDAK